MKAVWMLLLLAIGSAVLAADVTNDGSTPRTDSETCLVSHVDDLGISNLGTLTRYHVLPDANPDASAHMLVVDALVGAGLDVTWGRDSAPDAEVIVEIHGLYHTWMVPDGVDKLLVMFRSPQSNELIGTTTYDVVLAEIYGTLYEQIELLLGYMRHPGEATPC